MRKRVLSTPTFLAEAGKAREDKAGNAGEGNAGVGKAGIGNAGANKAVANKAGANKAGAICSLSLPNSSNNSTNFQSSFSTCNSNSNSTSPCNSTITERRERKTMACSREKLYEGYGDVRDHLSRHSQY